MPTDPMDKDVTAQVEIGEIDGDLLELVDCVCGVKLDDQWEMVLGTNRDNAFQCRHCGRRLYFSNKITVYQVIKGEESCPEKIPQAPRKVQEAKETAVAEAKAEPQEEEPEARPGAGRDRVNER